MFAFNLIESNIIESHAMCIFQRAVENLQKDKALKHRTRTADFEKAKRNKKDEFYTKLEDIRAELKHYSRHFAGKVVYLNCDDPRYSNFFRFFVDEFHNLKLKALIASGFAGREEQSPNGVFHRGVWAEYEGEMQDPLSTLPGKAELRFLNGTGDFREEESLSLLKRADIVVTNPPFSQFRDYFSQLTHMQKDFIILANMNAVTYVEVFPYFKNDSVWYGPSIHSGDREFLVPKDYPLEANNCRIDEEGNRYIRVKGVRWFTNLHADVEMPEIKLSHCYQDGAYPRYVNYPAIEIGRTARIPKDYYGEMGVPISFMDHYRREQFEIVGSSNTLALPMKDFAEAGTFQTGGPRFYLPREDGSYRRMYERIVIKRREANQVNR